jgi:hypothetical protein
MKTYTDFARYGNPTPLGEVLGLHFDKAIHGELRYLNINTTYNSSILLNFRQTENAFWSEVRTIFEFKKNFEIFVTINFNFLQYLPTVIGVLVPTYPPSTEFWWEPKEPLQIAFWSVSMACLILLVLLFMCCIMWRNAKRYGFEEVRNH